ncbi:MAG: IucA/IucC family siderophore biosynthesis protein [Actinobacteria bacterium]|nr:IucA/IucC family siderophore biosynthesis protein [Actinomycetota bacterium]
MRATDLAEGATVQRLLNAYLRESGSVPVPLAHAPAEAPGAMCVRLPLTGACLATVPTHLSPTGHHRFGPCWWETVEGSWRPVGAMAAAQLLVAEVAATDPDQDRREERRRSLLAQVADSTARTARYLDAELRGTVPVPVPGSPDVFLNAEQALRTGHPFHPTPKSVDGFSDEDLKRYAPELGAVFALHWLALAPEVTTTVTVHGGAGLRPLDAVRPEARARLGGRRRDWPLLAVHPWQAAYLHDIPDVRSLVEDGLVVPLGPLGGAVTPTSSVRTVWDPSTGSFLKLPLAVRITNFVRVNPPVQLDRSLHASGVLAWVLPRLRLPGLSILLEQGYRALRPACLAPEGASSLIAASAVLVRQGPALTRQAPMVVAALLEPSARTGEPLLAAAVHAAGRAAGRPPDTVAVPWLRCYLEVSLVPLVRLLAEGGVGLEAHTQNALVTLEDGWPAHMHVRDLEGTSVDGAHPLAAGGYGGILPSASPALYSTDEVWRRFAYYVVVNHLGDLVATLARSTGPDEGELWREVRGCLVALGGRLPDEGKRRVHALVSAPELPAKANFASRFLERSEEPMYVAISNPLRL